MDLVTCPICLHEFNTSELIPLILHCGHTICKKCIENTERKMGAIQCPLCRGFDYRGVSTIKKNLIVFQNINPTIKELLVPCSVHPLFESIYFCLVENIPFCSKCATAHKNHDFYDIDDQFITQGTDIELNKKIEVAQEYLKQADEERKQAIGIFEAFKGEKQKKEDEIHAEFDKIIEFVNLKRKDFVGCLNGKYNSTAKKIQKVIENCEDLVIKRKQFAAVLMDEKKKISRLANTARFKAYQQISQLEIQPVTSVQDMKALSADIEQVDLTVSVATDPIIAALNSMSPATLQNEEVLKFEPKKLDMEFQKNNPLQEQLIKNLQHKGIEMSEKVKKILESIDRKYFMPAECKPYEDCPQRIGFNTTISAPHMHAFTLTWLEKYLIPGSTVLDVGCGSGYLTVCLAKMMESGRIYGVDHIEELINQAMENINQAYPDILNNPGLQINMVHRDGRLGLAEYAPFNVIHIGASTPEIPKALIEQLALGGVLMAPVGPISAEQRITIVEKDQQGHLHYYTSLSVSYAPLTDREKQCPVLS